MWRLHQWSMDNESCMPSQCRKEVGSTEGAKWGDEMFGYSFVSHVSKHIPPLPLVTTSRRIMWCKAACSIPLPAPNWAQIVPELDPNCVRSV